MVRTPQGWVSLPGNEIAFFFEFFLPVVSVAKLSRCQADFSKPAANIESYPRIDLRHKGC
jgi:hypothetical protein